ncbi:hypothetical protein [Geodermatophilus sp. DF01-2]|uniref:hypothetical protein n=1 Tax=Geodermatophilus sp. DF01-2 TaxID=2559610 RepID=UPI001ADDCCAF|nr:hypothetical protein [Geodermatophilus sp. DF01_2]
MQEGRERFTARGVSGACLRVLETGNVDAGDPVEIVSRPDHGVTVGLLFRATTTQRRRLPEIAPAVAHLPLEDQPKLAAGIAARPSAQLSSRTRRDRRRRLLARGRRGRPQAIAASSPPVSRSRSA